MILGAHMSIAKGFTNALLEAVNVLECNAMQIFLKSPRGGKIKPLNPEDIQSYQEAYDKYDFQFVIGHASYLLNLAKPLPTQDDWQSAYLLDDLEKLSHLHGKGLVYHTGKYLKLPYEKAKEHLVENLKRLLDQAHQFGVPLLLENGSGQGTEMGLTFEELKSIIDSVGAGDMLSTCIDTCHAFAAGYDLTTPSGVDSFFEEINQKLGFNNLTCFHFNDSKMPCGSNRDRHANFGQGHIPVDSLQHFLHTATDKNIPIVIETPLVDNSHLADIQLLKSWAK